jgi:DNA polymerase III delta prime subunit
MTDRKQGEKEEEEKDSFCFLKKNEHSSVKSLANYCEDVRFQRPNQTDIAGRMKVIMENEGLFAVVSLFVVFFFLKENPSQNRLQAR